MDKVLCRAIRDGKTTESQIVLGLLVSEGGYPLSYSIFNGSQYEGCTMIPIIDDFIQRFSIKEFVVVADSGLMSDTNVKLLRQARYKYILGARIRSEKNITNTSLDASKVIDQYNGLWVVERVFRISKGQLETRPIFHFTERRIEAHICI